MADTSQSLPAIGSTWKHHRGDVYRVLGLLNMMLPEHPGYPPMIRYCDAEGHEYSGRLDDWHRRMTWLADPQPSAAPIDPDHARRVAELLSANSREVEARREAQRESVALKARVAQLLQLGRERIIYEEFDCPDDAPESVGLWCPVCREHVEDDRVTGHDRSCPLNDHPQPDRPDPANDAGEATRIRDIVRQHVSDTLASPSERVAAECNAVLEQLAAERGCTAAEVLRDAIAHMRLAHHG